MPFGSSGRIVRVDLSHSIISDEWIDEATYRLYPGAKALAGYLLLKELPRSVDPLGPENILILANGLLTGAPFSTATRFTAAARSPLTGAYGESEAGGFWGPELKQGGIEALIITGKAEHPVYLWINDGNVEIRNARHLWGRFPDEVQDEIRAEFSDDKIQVLQTGIAGEKLVRYAALTHNMRHFNGRTGMGAVMGSKNLKAVAVRSKNGRYKDFAYDINSLQEIGKMLAKRVKEHPQSWDLHEKGTMGLVAPFNAGGILPTRNFREGSFEGVDRINWDAYEKEILVNHLSCHACAIRCKPQIESKDRYQLNQSVGGPEYEGVGGLGSSCAVADIQAVAKGNELCNRYVLDVISTAGTIAFAMECYENGLIDKSFTDGLDLCFGNAEAMIAVIEMIGERKGFGNILAEGSYRTANIIGGNAMDYAMQVKGQELAFHEPRGKVNVGIGFAVSETGADHLVSIHDTALSNPGSVSFQAAQKLGIQNAYPPRTLNDEKVFQYLVCEKWLSLGKALGLCYFGPAPRSYIQVDEVVNLVHAASGWDVTLEELLRVGERANTIARVFNCREGFRRADDTLPKRLFTPMEGTSVLAGVAYPEVEFQHALDELYRLKGWDIETGIPTRPRLEELEIGWATKHLE